MGSILQLLAIFVISLFCLFKVTIVDDYVVTFLVRLFERPQKIGVCIAEAR